MYSLSKNQQGAVLIISMIMLLLLTILGIASMRNTGLEERMAGNARDNHLAFEAAEAALIDAERFLDTVAVTGPFDLTGNDGLYAGDVELEAAYPVYEDIQNYVDWTGGDANRGFRTATIIGTGEGLASPPRYVIQLTGMPKGEGADNINLQNYGQGTGGGQVGLFRITARGTGGSDNSVVFLQTVYGIDGL